MFYYCGHKKTTIMIYLLANENESFCRLTLDSTNRIAHANILIPAHPLVEDDSLGEFQRKFIEIFWQKAFNLEIVTCLD